MNWRKPQLSPAEREMAWRKASQDPFFFIENFCKIRVPGRGLIDFELRPAQRETLQLWLDNRYTIALKARQIGFSTLVAAYVLWLIIFHPNMQVVMLSRTERDAIKLQKKVKLAYKHLPAWLKERAPERLDDNQMRMSFANDSVVESLPSENDPARGESVDLVVVDEWAFLPNPEEAWASIEPIADIGGAVIGISTANGAGNFFHEMYVKAKAREGSFVSVFFPWSAVAERDEEWYERKRKDLPYEWQLHQEYPRDDVECFIKSGAMVFNYDEIHNQEQHRLYPPTRGFLVQYDDSGESHFSQADDGPLWVWTEPEPGVAYVIGVDVAEGLEHGDYTVAHVIDTKTDHVVAKWRGHIAPDLLGSDVLWHLGWWYNAALIGVEANNHGFTTLTVLNALGYPNIYRRYVYDERTMKRQSKLGWFTQKNTKNLMIGELAMALRSEIHVHDEATIVELERYVRDEKGRMQGSPFDDQVMSLAVANQMRKHEFTPHVISKRSRSGTWGEVLQQIDERKNNVGTPRVGQWNRRTGALVG